MTSPSSKLTFFRQSGWMMIATVLGGALMYGVHIAAGKMDPADLGAKPEYGVFTTMLQVLTLMTIPAIGLQTTVMRQTVAALSDSTQRQLSQAVRRLLGGTFLIWLIAVGMFALFQGRVAASFKVSNPATLWLVAGWGLGTLWLPVFMGLLQGRQNFLWMGWVSILGGLIRLVMIALFVLWLGWQAAGACFGVLLQVVVVLALAAWETRAIWLGPGEPVAWRDWGKRVLPLTIGPGVVSYMMSLDMLFVQAYFPEGETGYYGAAGMIGRALVFLTAPLTMVMFPKVVASAAKAEKSDAMLLALGATALIGAGAALACTVLPSLPLRIIYDASYLKVAWLVPWFAWCMLPLSLGAVLVNALLARERYWVVVWLVVIALGYAGALSVVCKKHSSPLLAARSFQNLPALAEKLRGGADPVSQSLWAQFSAETKRSVSDNAAAANPAAGEAVAGELNRILEGSSIYDASRFAGVSLSKAARQGVAKNPSGPALGRLNRLLLEEAYPAEIVPMVRGFLPVVQTLGVFGLVLMAVALWFTVRSAPHRPTQEPVAVPPVE